MVSCIESKYKLNLLLEMTNESKFQILEYDKVIDHKNDKGKKQMRIILEDSAIKIDKEKIGCIKGQVWESERINGDYLKNVFLANTKFNTEGTVLLQGLGEVITTSRCGDIILIELQDEEIIIDKDSFIACEDTIQLRRFLQRDSRTYLEDLEPKEKISLIGDGIVALYTPVVKEALIRYKLFKDRIVVSSENVFLHTGNIKFEVNTLKKGSLKIKDENVYDIYSGVGDIWIYQLETPIINIDDDNK